MDATEQAPLVRDIERFCREAGLSEATFGDKAGLCSSFVRRLREGRVTYRSGNRAREYMAGRPGTGSGAGAGLAYLGGEGEGGGGHGPERDRAAARCQGERP